jgi:hypothetical protein
MSTETMFLVTFYMSLEAEDEEAANAEALALKDEYGLDDFETRDDGDWGYEGIFFTLIPAENFAKARATAKEIAQKGDFYEFDVVKA